MSPEPDLARLAGAVTEPARAAILSRLLDGRSWTATELAQAAGIRAAATSAHLKRLLSCDLIRVSPTGRHRYFRLAGAHVARLIEQLQCVAPPKPATTPGQKRMSEAMRTCRLCYDHLAGALAVSMTEAMLSKGWLVEDEPWYRLTDQGAMALAALDMKPMTGRTCMDWSERKLHLAGPLGAQLADAFLQRKLVSRDPKSRALRITARGSEAMTQIFGVREPSSA